MNNLVLVIQHAQNLTLQQAINAVAAMISSAVQLFEQAERALPSFSPELTGGIQTYVDALKAWMRGNLDWSAQTSRYAPAEPSEAASYPETIVPNSVLLPSFAQSGAVANSVYTLRKGKENTLYVGNSFSTLTRR